MVASLKKCWLPGLARPGLWKPPSKTDEATWTHFSNTILFNPIRTSKMISACSYLISEIFYFFKDFKVWHVFYTGCVWILATSLDRAGQMHIPR